VKILAGTTRLLPMILMKLLLSVIYQHKQYHCHSHLHHSHGYARMRQVHATLLSDFLWTNKLNMQATATLRLNGNAYATIPQHYWNYFFLESSKTSDHVHHNKIIICMISHICVQVIFHWGSAENWPPCV